MSRSFLGDAKMIKLLVNGRKKETEVDSDELIAKTIHEIAHKIFSKEGYTFGEHFAAYPVFKDGNEPTLSSYGTGMVITQVQIDDIKEVHFNIEITPLKVNVFC